MPRRELPFPNRAPPLHAGALAPARLGNRRNPAEQPKGPEGVAGWPWPYARACLNAPDMPGSGYPVWSFLYQVVIVRHLHLQMVLSKRAFSAFASCDYVSSAILNNRCDHTWLHAICRGAGLWTCRWSLPPSTLILSHSCQRNHDPRLSHIHTVFFSDE